MPTSPNFLERLLLFRLNKGPAPMLDLFGAGSLRAALLAADLDVFTELQTQRMPVDQLAAVLDAEPAGLAQLLRFLESQGYLDSTSEGYATTPMADRWATDAHGTNMLPWFRFWQDVVFPFWDDNLTDAVLNGRPEQTLYDWLDENPDHWPTAQAGFRAAGTILIDEITKKIDLPTGSTKLLDIGGGHGYYSMEFLDRTPGLTATIFDRPEALEVAEDDAAERGLEARLSVVGGDYTTDELAEDSDQYDVVLLFNVIHAHNEAETRALFERIRTVLRPGGRLVVLDQFSDKGRMPVSKAGIGFVSLTYLVTLGATVHDYRQVANWLQTAGFTDVSESSIRRAGPGNSLVHSTAPTEDWRSTHH